MNIDDSSQLRPCTSCQMCGAVCPTSAISIKLNKDGFYRPVINDDKCIDCGLCVKSCYKFDYNIKSTSNLESKTLYASWAKDPNIIRVTTSGGIADILAKTLIEEGYECIGVSYDTDTNCAVGKLATTFNETDEFRGSKYIQSYSVDVFKTLVKTHRKQKFAVFGLPCQIYAIDRFLRAKGIRENHILIDLYCHGCPTLNLWHKYVNEILDKTGSSRVISVNFRSKVRGWGNFYAGVIVVEGVKHPVKIVSPRINDPFFDLFFSDTLLNKSCYDCSLRGTLEYTDIRLGDFWGKSYVNNNKGVSGITLCSPIGHEIFNKIKPCIEYEKQYFNNFLPYQSFGKTYILPEDIRLKLFKQIANPSIPLSLSLKTYKKSLPIKKKILTEAKNIIKLMPNELISFIKGAAYLLRK